MVVAVVFFLLQPIPLHKPFPSYSISEKMWSHQASAPSIFLSATSKDSYFYLSERRTILNCSNSDLSILCLIPYLASSMITLLISIYYQFYSITKKKYNLSLTLLHPWHTTASFLPCVAKLTEGAVCISSARGSRARPRAQQPGILMALLPTPRSSEASFRGF